VKTAEDDDDLFELSDLSGVGGSKVDEEEGGVEPELVGSTVDCNCICEKYDKEVLGESFHDVFVSTAPIAVVV
jgi:hypothetical protein